MLKILKSVSVFIKTLMKASKMISYYIHILDHYVVHAKLICQLHCNNDKIYDKNVKSF